MYLLDLTSDFHPFGIESLHYDPLGVASNAFWSGGEINMRLDLKRFDASKPVRITTRLNGSNDIMSLLLATEALKERGFENIEVFFPYTPYARQDRVCNPGEAHGLRVFADLINAQGYKRVIAFDPHSYVTESLIRRCHTVNNHTFVKKVLADWQIGEEIVLVAPDAGAEKKMVALANYLRSSHEAIKLGGVLYAQKVRGPTGEIAETRIDLGDMHLEGRTAVIVDDICDGGRSFFPLAKLLKQKHAKKVALVVSHGIFSFGFADDFINHDIDEVFTTDSIRNWTRNITTLKMKDFINV